MKNAVQNTLLTGRSNNSTRVSIQLHPPNYKSFRPELRKFFSYIKTADVFILKSSEQQ